jgi:hypothetical protein
MQVLLHTEIDGAVARSIDLIAAKGSYACED